MDRSPTGDDKLGKKLAPFNPSNGQVIETALRLLELSDTDVFYDLGCGDGRLLIAAAQHCGGLRAHGVDFDRRWSDAAAEAVAAAGLADRVTVAHANALDVPLEPATKVFTYLVPEGMRMLRPALVAALKRGVRLVTYMFKLPDVEPDAVEVYAGTKIYLYSHRGLTVSCTGSPPGWALPAVAAAAVVGLGVLTALLVRGRRPG